MQISMLRLSKDKYLAFNKFHFILFCLFLPKIKKLVKNMSPATVINSALRVTFKKSLLNIGQV